MDFPISVLPSRSFDAFRSTEPRTVEPTTATPLPPGSVTPIQNRPSLWRTPPSLCSGACPPAAAGCPSCSTAADIDPDIHYIPAHRRLLIAYVACEPLEVAINDGSPRVKKGASISSILVKGLIESGCSHSRCARTRRILKSLCDEHYPDLSDGAAGNGTPSCSWRSMSGC